MQVLVTGSKSKSAHPRGHIVEIVVDPKLTLFEVAWDHWDEACEDLVQHRRIFTTREEAVAYPCTCRCGEED
jgi:hypothetical protein